MTRGKEAWGADTAISIPQPVDPKRPALIDFGGFGFGEFGICHNLTEAEAEVLHTPMYSPES